MIKGGTTMSKLTTKYKNKFLLKYEDFVDLVLWTNEEAQTIADTISVAYKELETSNVEKIIDYVSSKHDIEYEWLNDAVEIQW